MRSYLKSSKLKSIYAASRAYFLAKNITSAYKRLNPNQKKLTIKIFEIGPGRADLAAALIANLNTEYYICDIDKKVIDFCKKKISGNKNLKCKSINEISVDEIDANKLKEKLQNSFDIVISSHVIEHLESIEDHLFVLKKLLKNKGILYLASPNTDSRASKIEGLKWKGYQDPTHISLHSFNDIIKLFNSLNLKVILAGTSPVSFRDYFSFNFKNLFFSKSGLGSSYNAICQKIDN